MFFRSLLFFAWSLYFAFQSWLAASGKIARHRAIGVIGVSLATAMTTGGGERDETLRCHWADS